MKSTTPAALAQVRLSDGFWKRISDDVREKAIPYQWEALNDRVEGAEPSHCIHNATGKRELLDVMHRMGKHIQSVLGAEPGKLRGYPGDQEIELALVKLYHATGDEDMLRLAKYFIDERSQSSNFFVQEHERLGRNHFEINDGYGLSYFQAHLPVREQRSMEGHSVRALYMLSGMLDVARETGDQELMNACEALFENATTRRMYVTGGVGSTSIGEAFSFDYDLPNDTAYAETCASIALADATQAQSHDGRQRPRRLRRTGPFVHPGGILCAGWAAL